MFKRITAVLAAVLLGVGISVVAVAAPASAHTPTVSVDCNSIDYTFASYGGGTTNTFKVYLDGAATPVVDITFGNTLPQTSFGFDGSTSHTVRYVLDAQAAGYDKDVTVVTSPCTYPSKSVDVSCEAITAVWNGALTNGVHMNVRVQIGGTEKTLNAYVDQNVAGGYNGLGLVITDVNGQQTKLPLTEQQVKSGKVTWTYPTALGGATAWAVKWVQMDTKYFNQSGSENSANWMYCNYTTIAVETVPSFTDATCEADGKLVVPTQTGIVWSGGANNAGPGTYDLVAKPADGYTLTGQTKWTITVPPMKSGVECAPPCIPNSAVSYTYDPATNSGVIHVENVDGSNGELCKPFWVTATSWKFIEGDKVWSQVRDVVQQLPKIDAPGDYPYSAPVDCGQGDIYASFVESPNPPKYLHGPSNPWAEHFLHQMGFTGPNPTYTQDSPGCNIVVPVTPTATIIDECNEYGSVVVPANSAAFTYSVVGGPTEGKVTVTAKVNEGYVVQEGAQTVFEFDLGTYFPCKLIPGDPSSTDQKCVSGELTDGSITVAPNVGKIVYVITGGAIPAPGITVPDDNPVTTLPAGSYTVTAHGINGNVVGTENTWTYQIVIGEPENCEKVAIPVSTMSAMECVANLPTGTYTLPATTWVEWFVNGVLATEPVDVNVPGDVLVEAKITAAGIAAGIVFTDGTTSSSVTHTFVLPTEGCDPPTLALLSPTASKTDGSCTADPTYTLSNTTSEHGGVQWMVGNPQVATTPGTHKASWGSTVVVEATLVDPVNDGFELDAQTEWTFTFPAKPACGDLITLALTGGSTGGFVPWIAGFLLLLGGAGIYFQRRLVASRK